MTSMEETLSSEALAALLSKADLMGVSEIAEEFGVPKNTVSMWDTRRETTGFPEPVLRLRMGPIYRREDVARFLEGRRA